MFSLRIASRFARTLCAVILVLSLSAVPPCAAQESGKPATADSEKLTNEDVLKLSTAGLPPNVITAKISASETDFDTSIDTLLALSEAGIHADVLAAMTEAGKKPAAPAPVAADPVPGAAPSNPAPGFASSRAPAERTSDHFAGTPCKQSGIFLNDGQSLRMLHAAPIETLESDATRKVSNRRSALKQTAVLHGIKAQIRLENEQPKFLFCFENVSASSSLGGSEQLMPVQQVLTPRSYVLVQMRIKDGQRYVVLSSGKRPGMFQKLTGNFMFTRQGIVPEDIRDIVDQRMSAEVYEVKPSKPLEKGEYAFYYGGGNSAGAMYGAIAPGAKLYAFGID